MKYQGSQSLDAEIYIDVVEGTVRMDYSSNSSHDPMHIRKSDVCDETNEWLALPLWKRIPKEILVILTVFWDVVISLEAGTVTRLAQHNLFPFRYQYAHQNFLKWYCSLFHGVYEEIYEGELYGTVLQIPIEKNVWIGYTLSGDYEKFVTNIDFERRIRKFRKFNTYNLFVQDGWILTFTFSQPPQSGSVKVEYV